jgi:hypothetical protein
MHPARTSVALDCALITTTSAWAFWLARHKEFEPDFTWVQVVAGTLVCLVHAQAQGALNSGDWQAQQWRVVRSFIVGGTPIIIGEIAQWLARPAERARVLRDFPED